MNIVDAIHESHKTGGKIILPDRMVMDLFSVIEINTLSETVEFIANPHTLQAQMSGAFNVSVLGYDTWGVQLPELPEERLINRVSNAIADLIRFYASTEKEGGTS